MGELLTTLNRLRYRLPRGLSRLAGPVLPSPYLRSGSAGESASTLLVGGRTGLGGPEALGIDAWARRLFAAAGDSREVIRDPLARHFGAGVHGGGLTPGEGARIGATDFETWLATQPKSRTMTEINVIVTGTASRLGPAIAVSWAEAAGVRWRRS